ncbi:MAG TPA: DUF2273 domain-containing protein [Bacillota bacterium]|jgi:uncharacterized membrane protein
MSQEGQKQEGSVWERLFKELFENHRGKTVGSLIGLAISLSIYKLGFLWTIFIAICVFVGYQIGRKMDEDKEGLIDILDRLLPPGGRER